MIDFKGSIERSHIPSENDRHFLERIFRDGIAPYKRRLKQYGFEGYQNVLDAGGGFGQWSLAFAEMNDNVFSCDADTVRTDFLARIVNENDIKNIDVRQGYIDDLPYADEQFDVVFCYGVLYITPWKKSLNEFKRVLKPGGKLYVNANGLGWYKNLWYTGHNQAEDYSPQKIAAETWLNTYKYKNNLPVDFPCHMLVEPDEMTDEMKALGFSNIKQDGEGLLGNPNNKEIFFKKEYFGDLGVYEVIAEKK